MNAYSPIAGKKVTNNNISSKDLAPFKIDQYYDPPTEAKSVGSYKLNTKNLSSKKTEFKINLMTSGGRGVYFKYDKERVEEGIAEFVGDLTIENNDKAIAAALMKSKNKGFCKKYFSCLYKTKKKDDVKNESGITYSNLENVNLFNDEDNIKAANGLSKEIVFHVIFNNMKLAERMVKNKDLTKSELIKKLKSESESFESLIDCISEKSVSESSNNVFSVIPTHVAGDVGYKENPFIPIKSLSQFNKSSKPKTVRARLKKA